MGLSVNNKQKVRQSMVKISRGGGGEGGGGCHLLWPDMLAEIKWLDHRKVNFTVADFIGLRGNWLLNIQQEIVSLSGIE